MYWEVAGGNDLQKYGEWGLIDSIATNYKYTHDEAFALSWSEALTIIAYNRHRNYVIAKSKELKHKAEESKK